MTTLIYQEGYLREQTGSARLEGNSGTHLKYIVIIIVDLL